MLKIKRKNLLSQLNNDNSIQNGIQNKSNILKWIEGQMEIFSFNLSDENADFFINNVLRQQNKLIIVQMYIKPKRGIFEQIEFRPKMYFSCVDLVKRPKIYNDRRIFHPNINIQTLEIIYPDLVIDWNPTKKLESLMKSLKYILIEPNISFVPNTELNKKAGMWYHFRRGQYRQVIFQNMPLSFDNLFGHQQVKDKSIDMMELELDQNSNKSQTRTQNQWFDVRSLYPSRISGPRIANNSVINVPTVSKRSLVETSWKDEEQIKILAKQMKKVHVFSDTESEHEPIMEIE